MKRTLSILILVFPMMLNAQSPQVVKWNGIEKYLTNGSDSIYVLNFWATWCRPCVKELPHFEKLQDEFADQKVKLVYVSVDFAEDIDRVKSFLEKKPLSSTVLLLDEPRQHLWIDKVDPEWGGAIPATLIVSQSGKIRDFQERDFETYEELKSVLKKHL